MQEKKGYVGAVVKGILLGTFVIYMLVFSHVGGGDFVAILLWLLSCALGIAIFVVPVFHKNQVIEREREYELRRIEERKEQEKKREIENERRRIQQARESRKNRELERLRDNFFQSDSVVELVKQGEFKEDLLIELKKLLNVHIKDFNSIIENPTMEKEPSSMLRMIAERIWNNSVFWDDIHKEWEEHYRFAVRMHQFNFWGNSVLIDDEYGIENKEYIQHIRDYDLVRFNEITDEWLNKTVSEEKLNFATPITALWKYAMTKPIDYLICFR